MKSFLALLSKDSSNASYSILPAIMLGSAILLLLQFTHDPLLNRDSNAWLSAFWTAYFFASTALFYRSYGLEHRYENLSLYSAFGTSHLKIFFSQAIIHFLSLALLAGVYLLITILFWSPINPQIKTAFQTALLLGLALAPLGTLLGLMLQLEREFLFSLIYFPLVTPLILGAYSMTVEYSQTWLLLILSFGLISGFVSALVFEFFFDELIDKN